MCIAAAQPAQVESQIREHFAAAQTAQRAGDLDTAAREYRAILALKPDFAEMHMNLGLVLHAQNKYDESVAALDRSLRLSPGAFAAGLFQGINFCKLGRTAEAAVLLAKAVAEQPSNKQACFWLGNALLGAGRHREAVVELENASRKLPDDLDILQLLGEAYQSAARAESDKLKATAPESQERRLLLADSLAALDEWMAAEIYYRKLLEQKLPPAGTHVGLGRVLLRQDKIPEAIRHFREEIRADAYSVEGYCALAEALVLEGNLADALENLRSALRVRPDQALAAVQAPTESPAQTPDHFRLRFQAAADRWGTAGTSSDPAVMLGLGLAYARLRENDGAQKEFHKVTAALSPRSLLPEPSSRDAAFESFRRREYEAVIGALRRYVKVRPQDFEARFVLAKSYLLTGEPAAAARELRQVLETDPTHSGGRLWLSKSYRDLTLLTFERLVALQPDSYRTHQLAAEAYEAQRQDEKAIAEFRAALEIRPHLAGLHLRIGRIHLKSLRLEEAAAEFQKELEINPFDADANADLGGIYVNGNQAEEAIPLLERALQIRPGFSEARRRLGKAYFAVRQYQKAAAVLEQAAATDEDGSTHYLLAKTYRQLGRTRDAERAFGLVTQLKSASLKRAEVRAERIQQLDREMAREQGK